MVYEKGMVSGRETGCGREMGCAWESGSESVLEFE